MAESFSATFEQRVVYKSTQQFKSEEEAEEYIEDLDSNDLEELIESGEIIIIEEEFSGYSEGHY